MDNQSLLWVVFAFLWLIFEMGNPGLFVFLSFFFGSLAGAVASWAGILLIGQLISALAVTVIAFIVLTLFIKKKSALGYGHSHKSNVYALQGQRGIVLVAINGDEVGQVRIGGEIWSAKSVHATSIAVGTTVEVVRVVGCHVIVQEIK